MTSHRANIRAKHEHVRRTASERTSRVCGYVMLMLFHQQLQTVFDWYALYDPGETQSRLTSFRRAGCVFNGHGGAKGVTAREVVFQLGLFEAMSIRLRASQVNSATPSRSCWDAQVHRFCRPM